MSQFVVDLSEPEEKKKPEPNAPNQVRSSPPAAVAPKKRFGCFKIAGVLLALFTGIALVVGYFYWQGVKQSPQYSLAMLVEAARNDDQKAIDELVDTDAVVDSFMPQIIDKATELYGRNLAPDKIARVKTFAGPLMPAIKQRARAEVPRVIKEKSDKFASVPAWAIAIGAGWYLDIKQNGETATVVSQIPTRQFELTMKRNGDKWRIVAIKDEALATRIAQTVGQELIAISTKEGLKKATETLNVPTLENLKKKVEELFR